MSQRKYALREKPKQTFDDEEWETVGKNKGKKNKTKKFNNDNQFDKTGYQAATGNDFHSLSKVSDEKEIGLENKIADKVHCIKCYRVFSNRNQLSLHEKTCLKLEKTDSFLKYMMPTVRITPCDIKEKVVLPSSQVVLPSSQDEKESTMSDEKTFANAVKGIRKSFDNQEPTEVMGKKTTIELNTGGQVDTSDNNQPAIDFVVDKNQPLEASEITKKRQNREENIAKPSTQQHKNRTKKQSKQPDFSSQPPIVEEQREGNDNTMASEAYEEITSWRRNLFRLPKGNIGKQFIEHMVKQIDNWISTNEEDALKLLMCMPSLLLQRTSKKGKARENKDNLRRRMDLWENGCFTELIKEGKVIQQRLEKSSKQKSDWTEEDTLKAFRNHMINGRINPALRLLDKTSGKGVLRMTDDTIRQLHEKHPKGEPINDVMVLNGPIEEINPVIFDDFNGDLVKKVALRMKGAAGPSGFDAEDWRSVLGSRLYGNSSDDLCSAIANMAKKLCTENRTENGGISALLACRLIPLDKDPGLRPIGIGEVLRRIIGKMVVKVLKPDLQDAAGELQMCVGQEGGCEAGVHAMHDMFQEENSHGIIQVDANNAFNVINRQVLLQNIQILCPAISTFLRNCYLKPARLFVIGGVEISSDEGTTQGAPTAMPTYAVGIKPLLICLSEPNKKAEQSEITGSLTDKARQAAFADDLAACGTIDQLKRWWDLIIEYGPYIGYHAKPSKSWLIVKTEHLLYAETVFQGTGLKITTAGNRHLGAVVGTNEFKDKYVKEKVDEWIDELMELENIAKVDPHIAYSAYVFGLQHQFTYVLRTIPQISKHLEILDKAIDRYLIQHLIKDHTITELERIWLSLPVRLGGMGLNIISEMAPHYYENSRRMTKALVDGIIHQYDPDPDVESENESRPVKAIIGEEKKKREEDKVNYVKQHLSPQKLKIYEAITEKGASSWLNALPLKDHDFYLDKQTFWDTIHLRYGLELSHLPSKCVCDENFSVEHALNCKRGGFISTRHNDVRDFTAEILSEVCNDVAVEPLLTPLTGERFQHRTANVEDHARLDVSARGVWMRGSRAFFDVKVFNPLARTYSNQTLKAAHKTNENIKKRMYNERVINVEHGTFTPLVFSCLGGMSVECAHFYNRMADMLSEKRNISTSQGRTWVRTKVSFCLLRATHLCIRGSRSRKQYSKDLLSETDIPKSLVEAEIDCSRGVEGRT